MQVTASDLCDITGGSLIGNPDVSVYGPSKIEEATEGTISFLANKKYESYLYNTKASIVIVDMDFEAKEKINATLIKVTNVYEALNQILGIFGKKGNIEFEGVSSLAFIHDKTEIPKDCHIAPFCCIGDVEIGKGTTIFSNVSISNGCSIGENVTIYAGVKIYKNCIIGSNVIIHSNAVIGSDGFGYSVNENGTYKKIDQNGNVVIEDNVEIGANTVIDRASIGSTIIRKGVKLDNLIQIAHNVEIGAYTAMAAQSGVAGSTKIGKYCQIGGQAGFIGHLKINNFTKVQAQSGVAGSVKKEGQKLYGYPAINYSTYLKAYAHMKNLPEYVLKLKELEKKIQHLESINKDSENL